MLITLSQYLHGHPAREELPLSFVNLLGSLQPFSWYLQNTWQWSGCCWFRNEILSLCCIPPSVCLTFCLPIPFIL